MIFSKLNNQSIFILLLVAFIASFSTYVAPSASEKAAKKYVERHLFTNKVWCISY